VSRRRRLLVALAVAALYSGPAGAGPEHAPGAGPFTGRAILILPIRVEVSETQPSGFSLLKAEWTRDAQRYVRAALDRVLAGHQPPLLDYQAPADPERQERHAQVLLVQRLLQATIVMHRYTDGFALPTRPRFEWSLGPGASLLGDGVEAQDAMFLDLKEHRPSRHFVNIAGLANTYTGSVTIVDLATGDVRWFNHEKAGDLTTATSTLATVKRLFRDQVF
jgi:hypothetical protein